jgi:hypothetical protein
MPGQEGRFVKSIWQETTRRELDQRIALLSPTLQPAWGKMTASRMVLHLTNSFRSATGELAVAPMHSPLMYTPIKQLVIYWLPFPKGVPTAAELLSGTPGEWSGDLAGLLAALDRFTKRDRTGSWPAHAAFGAMTGDQWRVLMYRHCDHHLRQFGI